jgi:hypothetical protein
VGQRRYQLRTTLYGKRLVTRDQLYELHREVSKAASLARRDDPDYLERREFGMSAAKSYIPERQAAARAAR